MKKIGVLYGLENTFANDLINNINNRMIKTLKAESVTFSAVKTDEKPNYDLIFDMVSEVVPFYSSILKTLELKGMKVISSQFSKYKGDFFYFNNIAKKSRVLCPKTAIIPTKNWPDNVNGDCLVNIEYPLNWESVFEYIGFPMIIKPNSPNSTKYYYKVYNTSEFFANYDLTGNQQMIVEEAIEYDSQFKAYVIGNRDIILVPYCPEKALQYRFPDEAVQLSDKEIEKIRLISKKISTELGFDFCSLEFGIKNNEIYLCGYPNQSTYIELKFLQDADYHNLLETTATFLLNLLIKPTHRFNSKSVIMRNDKK